MRGLFWIYGLWRGGPVKPPQLNSKYTTVEVAGRKRTVETLRAYLRQLIVKGTQ